MSTGTGSIGSGTTVNRGTEETTGTKKSSGTTDLSLAFDPTAKQALDTALTSSEYTKSSAMSDAQALSDATMKKLLEQQAPGLASANKAAGGYDSTTSKQLQDDLLARTSAAGSQVVLDAITKYGALRQGDVAATTSAVGATTGKKVSTTGSELSSGTMSNQRRSDNINTAAQGGTVICTQLFNDGHISQDIYRADQLYVDKHFSEYTINGYRFWAVPVVYLMRKNKYIYSLGKFFGMRWCKHCASHYSLDSSLKRSTLIEILMYIGVPVCFILGSILPEVKYYKLWEGS